MAPVRAVIFDLDECVIDSRPAWAYTVEQTLLAITGRQLRVSNELVEEYRRRPWRHAFAILTSDTGEADRCCALAETMYHRSGLKRLLVHDGIGMAIKRHDHGERLVLLRIGDGLPDDLLVPKMHAVEHSDGHADVARAGREIAGCAQNLHAAGGV